MGGRYILRPRVVMATAKGKEIGRTRRGGEGAKPSARRKRTGGTRGPCKGEGGRPQEGTPTWWENHIIKTADYVEAQGLPAMIHIVNRTKGWGGSKDVDWNIIQDLGRRLAGPDCQHYGFGITKFCRPVRRLLLQKIGFGK